MSCSELSIPCCVRSLCQDPANPFANLTAEGPDQEIFLGYNHGNPQIPPPPDWTWGTPGCVSFCTSTVSQADADLCAQRQQVECTTQHCTDPSCVGGGGDGGWTPPGGGVNTPLFANAAETGTAQCPDGLPFSFTLPAGSISGINQEYLNMVAQSLATNLAEQEKICLSDIPGACLSQPYIGVITCSGGIAPFSFTIIAGSLPFGLTASQSGDGTSLVISGTPTATGLYTFTVFCQDTKGLFMQKTYSIGVLNITNSPPLAHIGQAYSFQMQATGGTPPYMWGTVGGNAVMPPGLVMDLSGVIFGTPTTSGAFNIQITVVDSTP